MSEQNGDGRTSPRSAIVASYIEPKIYHSYNSTVELGKKYYW